MTTTTRMSMATDQVLSWLNEEESTVSAQTIQQECVGESPTGEESALSRYQASCLLQTLYQKDPNKYTGFGVSQSESNLELTNSTNETETIKVTTFSCKPLRDTTNSNNHNTTVMALAKADASLTEAMDSMHERDMCRLRDKLYAKDKEQRNDAWFYNHQELSKIQMAPRLLGHSRDVPLQAKEKTWHKVEREELKLTKVVNNNNNSKNNNKNGNSKNKNSSSSNNNKITKTKPTTAQSFFSKKPAASTTTKTKPAASSTSTTTSSSTAATNTTSKSSKPAFSKRSRPTNDDQLEQEETPKNIGTADDFVGDEDEDSEDEQEMQERLVKSKEIVRKQKEQDEMLEKVYQEQDKDLEDENPTLKTGAMDAFCVKPPKKSNPPQSSNNNKKRRKVLKEKTTVNAQGFLVTTTEAIWEDVSDDDEEEKAETKNEVQKSKSIVKKAPMRPKAKKPSDMKQGSLMGFFKKK